MDREKALPSTGSLPRCLQWLEWMGLAASQESGTHIEFSYVSGRNQSLEPSLLTARICISRKLESGARSGSQKRWKRDILAGISTAEPNDPLCPFFQREGS